MEAAVQLLDSAKNAMRIQQLSSRTEIAYLDWIYRYLLYHGKRLPQEMGELEVGNFLNYISKECKKSASTQNQAHCALLFLYNVVLQKPLKKINFARLKNFRSLPQILSKAEIELLLQQMEGVPRVVASLLYGCGLKIMEGLSLRIRNIDFEKKVIILKDRTLPLPTSLIPALQQQIKEVTQLHLSDLKAGFGEADVPEEIQKIHPESAKMLSWQYIFPAVRRSHQASTGKEIRFHLHESVLQKALKQALEETKITKKACCHSLRHSFAIHLLESGKDLATLQKVLGHRNKRSTMIYAYILQSRLIKSERSKIKAVLV